MVRSPPRNQDLTVEVKFVFVERVFTLFEVIILLVFLGRQNTHIPDLSF